MTKNKTIVKLRHINTTKCVLEDLNDCIINNRPFSIVRFGDAIFGILSALLAPGFIDSGKWSKSKGRKLANTILGQLTIPTNKRIQLCERMVKSANNADYIDSYDAYLLLNRRRLGIIARNWKEIHEQVGITNESYCSCFVHYFSIVDGEYNLFDIMKDRRIFCIGNSLQCLDKLKQLSGATVIDSYKIPGRGRRNGHYKRHFRKVMRLIKRNATKYDLFLIGAGFLGKIYCDEVKINGGRSFDAGRLFNFWCGARSIDSAPKRFLVMDKQKMLCRRLRKHDSGVW